MLASNEAAKKAGSGTHIAIRIDNLQFDEGFDEQSRVAPDGWFAGRWRALAKGTAWAFFLCV